jgi:hypothetical protein
MQQTSLKGDKTRHGVEEQMYQPAIRLFEGMFFTKASTLAGS